MATINVEICRKNKCSQFRDMPSADGRKYLCFYADPFQFESKETHEEQQVPDNCPSKDEH